MKQAYDLFLPADVTGIRANQTGANQISVIESLAVTLQKLESTTSAVDGLQYRLVVRRLTDEILAVSTSTDIRGLLSLYPAAAELYENLNFARWGLCLHDPEQVTVAAEATRLLIDTVHSDG